MDPKGLMKKTYVYQTKHKESKKSNSPKKEAFLKRKLFSIIDLSVSLVH